MLNPTHLRTLRAVLDSGSFADAARHLGYTPSAVSQQVSALERQLHVTLFDREAHAVRPTPVALVVGERALAALGALRVLEDDVQQLSSGRLARLRVISFPTASERLLPAALSTLRRELPRVDVELDEAEPPTAMRLLGGGEADVVLVHTYGTARPRWAQGHDLVPVLEEDLMVITPAARPGDGLRVADRIHDLGDLAGATWVATKQDTWGAATLARLCRDSGFEPDVRLRSNNYGVLQRLVASGLGTALVPAISLDRRADVVARAVDDPAARRRVSVVVSSAVPAALSADVVGAVRRAAAKVGSDHVRVMDGW